MAARANIESIDTNIILRLILGDIPEQRQKALSLLQKPNTLFHIDDLAITEIVYVLQKLNYTRHEVAENILGVINQPNLLWNKDLFRTIFPAYLHHPALSFNDCYLSAKSAANHSEPLWTFDRQLAKISPTAKELK